MRSLQSSGLLERGHRRRMQVAAPSSQISSSAVRNAILRRGDDFKVVLEQMGQGAQLHIPTFFMFEDNYGYSGA